MEVLNTFHCSKKYTGLGSPRGNKRYGYESIEKLRYVKYTAAFFTYITA